MGNGLMFDCGTRELIRLAGANPQDVESARGGALRADGGPRYAILIDLVR